MTADYFVNDDDTVLKNKLGIIDKQRLNEAEQEIVTKNTAALLNTPSTDFSFNGLLDIHKVLFDEMYDFAGKVRTVDIAKPEMHTPFAYARFIPAEATRIFDTLSAKNFLSGLDGKDFIIEIAQLASELNALHPFREGNGRTIRLFLILLADRAGYLIDYSQVSAKELIEADRRAFEGNSDALVAVYKKSVIK